MLHTYYRMQLNVMCNLSYATTQICSCMCRMQLNFSCKRQLQNPKFLVVYEPFLPLRAIRQYHFHMQRFQQTTFTQEVLVSWGGGALALTKAQLLLTNYCQTLSSMIP
jgi:hypothetical protein